MNKIKHSYLLIDVPTLSPSMNADPISPCHQVYTDGKISFDGSNDDRFDRLFDSSSTGFSEVTPLKCDADTRRNDGRVYYRESTDTVILQQATSDVANGSAFSATSVFIATWHNVTYSIRDVSKTMQICIHSIENKLHITKHRNPLSGDYCDVSFCQLSCYLADCFGHVERRLCVFRYETCPAYELHPILPSRCDC